MTFISSSLVKAYKLKILKRARDLIEKKGWTQGRFAETKAGKPSSPYSSGAASFCAVGAMNRARREIQNRSLDLNAPDISLARSYAENHLRSMIVTKSHRGYGLSMSSWNDRFGRTKEQVLKLFDRAIKDIEKK